MWGPILIWLCLYGCCTALPFGGKRNMPIIQREEEPINAAATENEANKPEAATAVADELEAAAPPSMSMISTLTLPSNATSIRADITDGFSCANKSYGYYADVENDCQIFHVCLPVTYADGKEHTFRWSFICPEDTIFSQDSFTCMRREDMTIDCEDSSQYYELNRNFGMIEEDTNNNGNNNKQMQTNDNSNQQITAINGHSDDQLTAMTQQMPAEQPQSLPQVQFTPSGSSDEKPTKHTTAPAAAATPQKQKPLKAPKPSRRKPVATIAVETASSVASKKKPSRTSATTTKVPLIDATTLTVNTAEEAEKTEVKPAPPKYTKRPTISTNLKEKLQPVNQPDTVPIRIELYNQKRKRPSFLNKKGATIIKPVSAEIQGTVDLLATTTMSTMDMKTQEKPAEIAAATADHVSSQASETSEVFVKPASAPNTNENKKVSKPQPTEPEVGANATAGNLEEMPAIKPLEAFEEIPAVITEVEDTNDGSEASSTADAKPVTADAAASIEEQPMIAVEMPTIFQQNSEEASPNAPSIEDMEQEKPADAPETVTAAVNMEEEQPMVEEMFSETLAGDENKQTMGGFKPVDPAMAAEAEALIANFLNTLMKSEQSSAAAKPANTAEIIEPQASTENDTEKDETKDEIKDETAIPTKAMHVEGDLEPQEAETVKPAASATLTNSTTIKSDQPSILPTIIMMHNQPENAFQIPVQVIQTPIDELAAASKPTAVVKPLSIDDVVELVKEQLDNKPTSAEAQVQTIVEPNQSIPQIAPLVINDESKYQKLGEELILPIYQRVSLDSAPQQQMLKAPSGKPNEADTQHSEKPEENLENSSTKIETETKTTATQSSPKIGRAERARSLKTVSSLDPRKRRFLFRSDAS